VVVLVVDLRLGTFDNDRPCIGSVFVRGTWFRLLCDITEKDSTPSSTMLAMSSITKQHVGVVNMMIDTG